MKAAEIMTKDTLFTRITSQTATNQTQRAPTRFPSTAKRQTINAFICAPVQAQPSNPIQTKRTSHLCQSNVAAACTPRYLLLHRGLIGLTFVAVLDTLTPSGAMLLIVVPPELHHVIFVSTFLPPQHPPAKSISR